MVTFTPLVVAAAACFHLAGAHPGHDATAEAMQRTEYLSGLEPRALARCAPKLQARGYERKMMERRLAVVREMRQAAGFADKPLLSARDFKTVLAKDHSSKLNLNANTAGFTPDWTLLGQNKSVVLSPETTEGPYYISGESIRRDVTDGQKGVPMTLDIQMINMQTCEPLSNVAVDLWSCNATGVYGGVVTPFGNGNGNDQSNLQNKALRGIQVSKADGSVIFDTLVPGHYIGRTHHIHVMSHTNAQVLPNNTISGGTASHVGQIFFDQSLVDRVEKVAPYNTNKQQVTRNENDMIMGQEAAGDHDPVVEYVLIGDSIEDGLFAWINFGVDPSVTLKPMAVVECGADGCKAGTSGIAGIMGALSGILGGLGGLFGGTGGGAGGGLGGLFGGLFGPGPVIPTA